MDTNLGCRIKYYRVKKGLSQERLALTCGLAPATVSHWETGKSRPNGNNIQKLVSVLGIDESALFAPSEELLPPNEILREIMDLISEFDDKGKMLFLAFARNYKDHIGNASERT